MTKVLIGAPCRQKPEIFQHYLASLRSLRLPDGVTADRLFILHNSPELAPLLLPDERYAHHTSDDSFQKSDDTHHWQNENVRQVSIMKNLLMQYALDNNYDYYFLVDSDLVLHPETLAQLLSHNVNLIANVFWTAWHPGEEPMPNAWDLDGYTFYSDTLERWREPGCYKTGMSGACFLISRKVIAAGVNYSQIPNLSPILFPGEDRHFCIRAACAGFQVYIETTYPATHLYRDSELEAYERGVASCSEPMSATE